MRGYIQSAKGSTEPMVITSTRVRAIQLLYEYWTIRLQIESSPGWKRRWGRRRRGRQAVIARQEDEARAAERS